MSRSTDRARIVALTLLLAVGAALLVPLCPMPGCETPGAAACAGFQPACDECPPRVTMRHERTEAISVTEPAPADLASTPAIAPADTPLSEAAFLGRPALAAVPPPLSPLGVRILI